MGVRQAPEAGSFLEGTNPLPGPQAEQRVAGEGSSRLRTLCVWRLSSGGGQGPLCAQGMGKLSLAGHTRGSRSQSVQDLARLVREGAVDRRVAARLREGLGFTWGGMDGSGTLERER